ncbi:MAG: hypothetical protein K1X72_14450 [Pyrinomonadaceae bacterium]|nr:hypothetical protein [Pyrinomonadaceae bacterium]
MPKTTIPKIFALIISLIFGSSCDFDWIGAERVQANYGNLRSFTVTNEIQVPGVKKIGLNLGFATSWGAEQLNANVIKNPGFEGLIDRALVIVKTATPGSFTDNESYLGRPDGFWTDAFYEVRSGRNAGRQGKIINSRKTNSQNLPDFTVDDPTLTLDEGDVISLTKIDDDGTPARWWFSPESADLISLDKQNIPPNSTGKRSLSLNPQTVKPVSVSSYLDAITERAGKMLPVNGLWSLSFWTLRKSGTAKLTVSFGRKMSVPFVQKNFTPSNNWTKTVINFNGKDTGENGILELTFKTSGEEGQILLDDVELKAIQSENSPFRAEVINALEKIQPAYLRDWQGQLGDTIENRLADRFARRTVRIRPENLESADFYYSIPDFFELCKKVNANPWLIIPTTSTDAELLKLGQFLSAQNFEFSEIVLEFGNENWNRIFRAAGISNSQTHGEIANRAFAKINEGAGKNLPLKFLVNGQHANPDSALAFLNNAEQANGLSVAPYFLYKLESGKTDTENLRELFREDGGKMRKLADETRNLQKDLAVYEVNLHTTGGNADSFERDEITAGLAAGTALAKVLLENLSLGVQRQCVYTLSGFDAKGDDGKTPVKLWGIVRDLGETQRFRPQGLALILLNRVIQGDLVKIKTPEANEHDVLIYVFKSQEKWSAAVVSTANDSRRISIRFPAEIQDLAKLKLFLLDAKNPTDTNEETEKVKISEAKTEIKDGNINFEIPPFGFAVLVTEKEKL